MAKPQSNKAHNLGMRLLPEIVIIFYSFLFWNGDEEEEVFKLFYLCLPLADALSIKHIISFENELEIALFVKHWKRKTRLRLLLPFVRCNIRDRYNIIFFLSLSDSSISSSSPQKWTARRKEDKESARGRAGQRRSKNAQFYHRKVQRIGILTKKAIRRTEKSRLREQNRQKWFARIGGSDRGTESARSMKKKKNEKGITEWEYTWRLPTFTENRTNNI